MIDVCSLCGKLTPEQEPEHLKNNHIDSSGLVECFFCDYKTELSVDLVHHLSNRHDFLFNCKLCDHPRSFFKASALKEHVNLVHPNIYKCKLCRSLFTDLKQIRDHVVYDVIDFLFKKIEIIENVKISCPDPRCGQTFTKKRNLTTHFKNHYGFLPFVCKYCTYGSDYVVNVKNHIKKLHRKSAKKCNTEELRRLL